MENRWRCQKPDRLSRPWPSQCVGRGYQLKEGAISTALRSTLKKHTANVDRLPNSPSLWRSGIRTEETLANLQSARSTSWSRARNILLPELNRSVGIALSDSFGLVSTGSSEGVTGNAGLGRDDDAVGRGKRKYRHDGGDGEGEELHFGWFVEDDESSNFVEAMVEVFKRLGYEC